MTKIHRLVVSQKEMERSGCGDEPRPFPSFGPGLGMGHGIQALPGVFGVSFAELTSKGNVGKGQRNAISVRN